MARSKPSEPESERTEAEATEDLAVDPSAEKRVSPDPVTVLRRMLNTPPVRRKRQD